MARFFVSYTQVDRAWAEWIAWQLEEAEHETILQAWDFDPGSNFVHEMQRATKEADRTVAILSPDYLSSSFGAAEWYAAFRQDPLGEGRRILPVRIRDCRPEGLLGSIVYLDLVGKDETTAQADLVAAAESTGRAKPESPPPFPGQADELSTAASRSMLDHPPFPGAPASVWNVPHTRNPDFTGRKDLLSRLAQTLVGSGKSALGQVAHVLHGLGGVGKTHLAVEYAYQHEHDYDVVWWIRADEPAALTADYAALAHTLGLTDALQIDQSPFLEAMRQWLELTNRRCLLVFDNANEPSDLEAYLPRRGHADVLVTSRSRDWPRTTRLEVDVLTPDEAPVFLCRRTGQDDESAAAALANELGYLPLALEQAAAYVDARGLTFTGYLERFREHHADLLSAGRPADYAATVATTWDLSFRAASEQTPVAGDLMNLLSFLAPDAIPLDLFISHAARLPGPLAGAMADPIALDDGVAALRRYALVESVDDRTLAAHRLVQLVTRDRMSVQERRKWAEAALVAVNLAFPEDSDDVRTWPTCARLLAHGMVVSQHGERLGVDPASVARLQYQIGRYLRGRGQFNDARSALERALTLTEVADGSVHPNVAVVLNALGLVLHDQGNFAEARRSYERALAINEAAYGPDHLEVAIVLSGLGSLLRELGEFEEARRHFERVVAIMEARLGSDAPQLARALNGLANILYDLKDPEAAGRLLDRALPLAKIGYGMNHPWYGALLGNRGRIAHKLGRLDEALRFYQEALTVMETTYDPEHPEVAHSLNNLAVVLREQGKIEEAKQLSTRALQIVERAYGPDHPRVAVQLNTLAGISLESGDIQGARKLSERGLQITEAAYGSTHPSVAMHLRNLAIILQMNGEEALAEDYNKRAMEAEEASPKQGGEGLGGMATSANLAPRSS